MKYIFILKTLSENDFHLIFVFFLLLQIWYLWIINSDQWQARVLAIRGIAKKWPNLICFNKKISISEAIISNCKISLPVDQCCNHDWFSSIISIKFWMNIFFLLYVNCVFWELYRKKNLWKQKHDGSMHLYHVMIEVLSNIIWQNTA